MTPQSDGATSDDVEMRDYSQYGEQKIILNFVRKYKDLTPYCVDAGAYDGEIGSNSRALFLKGWTGVVIEPDPRTFQRLRSLYADRPEVHCIECALGERPSIATMQISEGPQGTPPEDQWKFAQVSTFDPVFANLYKRDYSYRYRPAPVLVTTLTRVLDEVQAPYEIGFMTIDCEGMDLSILRELDFKRYHPSLICIECEENDVPMISDILAPLGYYYWARTLANTFFISVGAKRKD